MDLTDMISGGTEEQQVPEQKLTKEEYAAKKQQEREEVWAEVDSQAQGVFQDGEKLKGFLDFMAECNTQRTPNLLLIYGQHPDFKVVRSYERWREEHRSVKVGEHGITYMISTEYEKDGEMRRGYTIGKGFDISQMSGKPLEERPQRSLTELIGTVLKDQSVRVQIEDDLPDKVQAQYNPRYRTIYIRNGMSEVTTFHALNRELACAALDQHTGTYSRQKVSAQAYCAAYVIAKRYGVDVTGFNLEYIAQRNECGKKDPQELRDFLNDGKWDYKNASDLRYWPTEALDFYAFNPGTVDEAMQWSYMWEATKDIQKITYSCSDEYGSGINAHENYDVMYAIAKGQTKDKNNGVVKFNFKHILSQVVFKAKTEYDNMQVNIKDIKIFNVKMGGVYTLPATADGTGSWAVGDWPESSTGGGFITVVQGKFIEVNSNTTATDISEKTPMLNIPQKLTAWKVSEEATNTKIKADGAHQCYLSITCKIQQSGAYLLGSADNYGTIYVPFGATWEPGKRYIYTLIFGGGYTDQGVAVLNPIQFDAETTGWVDAANSGVNVKP